MRRLVSWTAAVFCAAPLAAAFAQGVFPGNDHSFEIGASPDGRFVVFTSIASNLVTNDTNGAPDVFMFDRQTSAVTRVSLDANGLQGNNISEHPSVSADGLHVAFDSSADNFGGVGGPFIKNLGSGAIQRLDDSVRSFPSLSDDGNVVAWDRGNQLRLQQLTPPLIIDLTPPAAGRAALLDWNPVVSGDGKYVAFATKRQMPGVTDNNGIADVYRYSVSGASYALASIDQGGALAANGPSGGIDVSTSYKRIAISGNGNRVAFYSVATDLTAAGVGGVFVHDFLGSSKRQVARCTLCNETFYAISISTDGNWIAFYAIGPFFDNDGAARSEGYFLYDYVGNTLRRLAGNTPGAVTVGQAFAATAVSNNGTQVVLQTNEKLVGSDRAPFADIFLVPQPSGATVLASRAALGAIDEGQSRMPSLSGDGKHVAFASFASNLGPVDTNDVRDVYVRAIGTGVTRLASTAANGAQGLGESRNPALSEDGRYVAFISDAANLTPDDLPDNLADVYIKDLSNGAIERVSRNPAGTGGGNVFLASAPALDRAARFVAFTSGASDLVAGDGFGVDAYIRDRGVGGGIVKASPTFDGSDPDISCNVCGHSLSLSDDGRYLAFQALANNQLATLDADNAFDVFVFDRNTSSVELISRNTGVTGVEADCDNVGPTISGDGRYVAFWSCATNLPGANGRGAIYVRDRTGNTTSRIASSPRIVDFLGAEPGPVFSRDGSVLAFVSFARDLVAGDTNALPDAFVFERGTGRIARASLSAGWSQANGASYTYDLVESIPRFYGLAIDRDGDRLAIAAAATNLVAADRNAADDVFVIHRANQAVERASAPDRAPSDDDRVDPAISGNASVAAATRTNRLGALGDAPASKAFLPLKWSSITLYNWATRAEDPIDVSSTGLPANGNSKFPALSTDGNYVAFASDATNLGALPDLNTATDVFLRDRASGTTVNVTQGANAQSGRSAAAKGIGDKWSVVFETNATNIAPGADTNGVQDVVLATQDAPSAIVSVSTAGVLANGPSGQPAISATGQFVSFTSLADNLEPAPDTNGAADVFVRDIFAGTTTPVSVAFGGGKPNGASGGAHIVSTGGTPGAWVTAFDSDASNIVGTDVNNDTDVFVRIGTGGSELISRGMGGAPANGKSFAPSIAGPGGRYVTFVSTASNLVPGDNNNAADVFMYNRVTGIMTLASVDSVGLASNDFALRPAVGVDFNGDPLVVWDSVADNLAPGDIDAAFDLFRRRPGLTEIANPDVLFKNGFE